MVTRGARSLRINGLRVTGAARNPAHAHAPPRDPFGVAGRAGPRDLFLVSTLPPCAARGKWGKWGIGRMLLHAGPGCPTPCPDECPTNAPQCPTPSNQRLTRCPTNAPQCPTPQKQRCPTDAPIIFRKRISPAPFGYSWGFSLSPYRPRVAPSCAPFHVTQIVTL
jgi:hypothetical protein